MQTVAISRFRSHLLKFLKKAELGEKILVTSHGHPMAMLVPPTNLQEKARQELSKLGRSAHIGDVVSPTGMDWKASL